MSQPDTDLAFKIAIMIEREKLWQQDLNIALVLAQLSAYFMLSETNHVAGDEFGAELHKQMQGN